MKILTFDIEEWYIEKKYNGARIAKYNEYDKYLNSILDLLEETNTKATFFCLGKIATDFPYVIKLIVKNGHEIGCHSNEHMWLTKMSPERLKRDTYDAIAALEDVSGRKVVSYRAPAFSIGQNNKWALEVLANEGIEYDASIFPASRDLGGFSSFPANTPVIISSNGAVIKEFPIRLTSFLGKDLAFSGGGYFRFFPYFFIKNRIEQSNYTMTYFHIGDLLHNKGRIMSKSEYENYFKEKGTLNNRVIRYLKSHIGTQGAFRKMSKLIRNIDLVSLSYAAEQIEWKSVKKIIL